jgi:hypothetical protein
VPPEWEQRWGGHVADWRGVVDGGLKGADGGGCVGDTRGVHGMARRGRDATGRDSGAWDGQVAARCNCDTADRDGDARDGGSAAGHGCDVVDVDSVTGATARVDGRVHDGADGGGCVRGVPDGCDDGTGLCIHTTY